MVDGGTAAEPVSQEEQERVLRGYIADNDSYTGLIIAIEDDVTDAMWADFFADVNAERKKRETWFEEIKAPLNEALRQLNAKQHLACDKLKETEDAITQARGGWMRIKLDKQRAGDASAIKEAEVNGGVAVLSAPVARTVQTAGGVSVGMTKQPSWRLTDDKAITAKLVERDKIEFDRSDPRLKNVPDKAFILKKGMIMALIKTGDMPEGEHSIEKFDDFKSSTR